MKFSVGEICEVEFDKKGIAVGWYECTITAIGNRLFPFAAVNIDYTIDVPDVLDKTDGTTLWLCREIWLRKKRPPEDDQQDYIPAGIRNIFREEVSA